MELTPIDLLLLENESSIRNLQQKNVKAELMSFRELFFTALPFLFIGYAAFQIVKSRRKMKRETKQILQDEED